MSPPDPQFSLAVQHYLAGRLAEAAQVCHQALAAQPRHADALHLLGVIASQVGRQDEAIQLVGQAIGIDGQAAPYHLSLANAQAAAGRLDEAEASLRRAIALQPGYEVAHVNLGNLVQTSGRLEEAAAHYRAALAINPDSLLAHYNLGQALQGQGRLADAEAHFSRAAGIDPRFAAAHNSLGGVVQMQGRLDDAGVHYRRAIEAQPDMAEAHHNLGNLFQLAQNFDQAAASYRRAVAARPDYAPAHAALANILVDEGRYDEAMDCFRRALALRPGDLGLCARMATALPVIYPSRQAIVEARERLGRELAALEGRGSVSGDPLAAGCKGNFFLAYHGEDDLQLQRATARMYAVLFPSLSFERSKAAGPAGRIRLGVFSAYLRDHTIGKLVVGLLERLDPALVEVVVLRPGTRPSDPLARRIDACATLVVDVPMALEAARERIAALELDVLFYPEIGMDPFTYFLAFARLAPVQATMWGHPDTTGIPTVDYFLSSEFSEPPGAEECYSERLVRLPGLAFYSRRERPARIKSRAEMGLPEDRRIYVCAQTLFKLHPDFDDLARAILQRDPEGVLVLISGNARHWDHLLASRFARTLGEAASRVVFLPRLSQEDFLHLMANADCLLDPVHFSGGNTSYEAFSLGLPIVTWPGPFMRSRLTAAQYAQMGMQDMVVHTAEEYVDLALRLAGDHDFRREVSGRIEAAAPALFEDLALVRGFERFLTEAV